jgi:hypothetical protein
MKKTLLSLVLFFLILLAIPGPALAQTYYFSLDLLQADVYWNEDGTSAIEYVLVFTNSGSADPIDYVDVGLPNGNYNLGEIVADVDGQPITDITVSPYVDEGVALGLGANAIRPGDSGRVRVFVPRISRVLFTDDQDSAYASAVFSTTFFGSEFVYGDTSVVVTFHLPPGVTPEQPRWHSAPDGFPSEPVAGFDESGRITYRWENPAASGSKAYKFGASFPAAVVPASSISTPTVSDRLNINPEDLFAGLFCFGIIGFFLLFLGIGIASTARRQLQYLPPKIAIEGQGIKRGLTAIEAAVLMEQPMDKVLTLILFAVLKKGAARLVSREPLEIEITEPLPEDLRQYEISFLGAFKQKGAGRSKVMQEAMVDLVKSVSQSMRGFSRTETIEYYKAIMRKAWAQVEAADTPEVLSQKYDEVMEWTMLDKDYDDKTREIFRSRPVYVPNWWWRYQPGSPRPSTTAPASTGGAPSVPGKGGGFSVPTLPGADFAASLVGGAQNFASGVVGNVSDFTSAITNKTNPVPKTTSSYRSSSGGGGRSCACACACAGCACACAGGGR